MPQVNGDNEFADIDFEDVGDATPAPARNLPRRVRKPPQARERRDLRLPSYMEGNYVLIAKAVIGIAVSPFTFGMGFYQAFFRDPPELIPGCFLMAFSLGIMLFAYHIYRMNRH